MIVLVKGDANQENVFAIKDSQDKTAHLKAVYRIVTEMVYAKYSLY